MKAYGRGEEPEIAAARNPPAYGAWNEQKSDDGNWGGPPRPGDLRVRHRKVGSYNRFRREVDSCRVGVGGGRSTAGAERTNKPPVREGPLLRRCVLVVKEEAR